MLRRILEAALPATGGKRVAKGLAALAPTLNQPTQHWEVSSRDLAPKAAFRVCPVTLTGNDGQPARLAIPAIAAAAGVSTPDIERFAALRAKIKSLTTIVQQPRLSAAQAAEAEADLNAVLEISPREEETLRLGAALYRSSQNDAKLASMLSSALTESRRRKTPSLPKWVTACSACASGTARIARC